MARSNRYLAVILIAYVALWFIGLGYRDLIDPDEGRYAEIPREMLASGDWLTPRLHDMRYFHKPPLQYWATATTFAVFGTSDTSARLWIATIGFAGAVWAAYVARRLFGEPAGRYAFVMTASGLLYCGLAHYLTVDMTLTCFMMFGVGCLLIAQQDRDDPRRVRRWMLAGWLALAAAVLTKGLIGVVLPGAAVLFYSLWQRDWALWRHLHLAKGVALLLAVSAPWFILMSVNHDEFAWFFFIHEHFARYTTAAHGHEGALYYFIPVFLVGVLPWTGTSTMAMFKPDFPWRGDAASGFDPERFLWVFVVFTFLFFSLGNSKLPSYLLPALFATALLGSKRMAARNSCGIDHWVALACGALIVVAGVIAPRFGGARVPETLFTTAQPWMIASGTALIAAGIALRWGRASLPSSVPIAGLFALLSLQCLLWGFQAMSPVRSGKTIADRIMAQGLAAEVPVYMVGTHLPSLPFYLDRVVTVVTHRRELAMSIDAEPEKEISKPDVFAATWTRQEQGAAMFLNKDYPSYLDQFDLPGKIIYQGPKYTAIVRSPAD